jgi:hypothetical protein
MGADLGNRAHAMRLECVHCDFAPPPAMTLEHARNHFTAEHETDDVAFELVAVCACGTSMTETDSRPTGGGVKIYLQCALCGNTGYIRRVHAVGDIIRPEAPDE